MLFSSLIVLVLVAGREGHPAPVEECVGQNKICDYEQIAACRDVQNVLVMVREKLPMCLVVRDMLMPSKECGSEKARDQLSQLCGNSDLSACIGANAWVICLH